MPLTVAPIFLYFPKKNVAFMRSKKNTKRCLYLGVAFITSKKNRRESVAFIWGVAFINPKKNEVYALIRSVAFIRVLLFGGVYPLFERFLAILGQSGPNR